jgi:hypothetical protein
MGSSLTTYPEGMPDVVDLGDRHFALQIMNDSTITFLWWHDCPLDRTWSWIGSLGAVVSGHTIASFDPLHVEGSLLCPRGCGDHGFVRQGRWVTA